MRHPRLSAVPTLLLLAAACGGPAADPAGERLRAVPTSATDPWGGLLHPVALDVDAGGRVYVGDQGDRTVKVFDPEGRRLHVLGGEGGGPEELRDVGDLDVAGDVVSVLDRATRALVRFAPDGSEAGRILLGQMEETFAAVGRGYALAASPRWSLPVSRGRSAPPLFRIVDVDGEQRYAGGERVSAESPFADHILNFVLPAGTPDGERVWLAGLNSTELSVFSTEERSFRSVRRDVPFRWARIPEDFRPTPEFLRRGEDAVLPFDAITLDLDTDGEGNAYVLTALGPSRARSDRSGLPVAVDRVDVETLEWSRHAAPETASDVAVSPDGRRVYLLDEASARVRVYGLE